jgi:Winged helix DNA-binding domain
MTARDIVNYRLVNQQIAQSRCKTPGQVVALMGAMQAQDYPGALWSIGLRLPNATCVDVEKAISERTIIRTWPMRGTLHFVAAADIRWMLELLAPRIIAARAARHQEFGLDTAMFARCEKVVVKALQGGNALPRGELLTLLECSGISTAEFRSYTILWRLAHEGIICFGSHQGKQPTFALLHEWAPKAKSLPREQALAKLALRYFTGHGPATLRDFTWWSGLKAADARAGLEMVSSRLLRQTVNGTVYWMPPNTPALRNVSPTAYLLPGFDEYMLGYTDRSAFLDAKHAKKVFGGYTVFKPTIVVDGHVAGLWRRAFKKNSVVITLAPFTRLKKAESLAVAAPAARFGQFHGISVKFSTP